jgi:hypothetical protein
MSDPGFSWQATRAGDVRIHRAGRLVTVLRSRAAAAFLAAARGAGPGAVQALCARVTRNYRRGNERTARRHPRNRGGTA